MQKIHDDFFEDDVPENESIHSPQKEMDVENEAGEEIGKESHYPISDYRITFSPVDMVVDSICIQIKREIIRIPPFQRVFVWDKGRASRFIESLALGLPVPQVFVFETKPNRWDIIDGQQRLLSIFYFWKGMFPKKKDVVGLHTKTQNAEGVICAPGDFDGGDFVKFRLVLPGNNLNGLDFPSLDEKKQISLKTVRMVVIRPHQPEDHRAASEIFSRLNTGGIKLSPQQVRLCVYESDFLSAVEDMNNDENWRALLGYKMSSPTKKDSEMILRSFAFLARGENIVAGKSKMGSMPNLLDSFANEMRGIGDAKIALAGKMFRGFVKQCKDKDERIFLGGSKKFSLPLFEAAFCASLKGRFSRNDSASLGQVDFSGIDKLRKDDAFEKMTQSRTTHPDRVKIRLKRAYELIEAI